MLEIGSKAPDFTLPDQNGDMHTLSQYRGQKVILYFYPRDNTAGCTKQACGFAERYPQIREKSGKRELSFWASVRTASNPIRISRPNTDCPLPCWQIRSVLS